MKTTDRPRNHTRARGGARSPGGARRRRQPTTAWIEQQRLMAIPTEWEIDPQTCQIGLEAIANIRAMFKDTEAEDAGSELSDTGGGNSRPARANPARANPAHANSPRARANPPRARRLPVGV